LIFITVGTQNFQFDRLLRHLDYLIYTSEIKEKVYAQIGHSTYKPKSYNFFRFTNGDHMDELYKKSDLIISHGGTSSIINALKMNKKIIVLPRLKRFNEHVDDHQVEICDKLQNEGHLISVQNIEQLSSIIREVRKKELKPYNFNNKTLLYSIEDFLLKNL
jgi:UDP-N-acetylglucosamine transferase subunit ALG13